MGTAATTAAATAATTAVTTDATTAATTASATTIPSKTTTKLSTQVKTTIPVIVTDPPVVFKTVATITTSSVIETIVFTEALQVKSSPEFQDAEKVACDAVRAGNDLISSCTVLGFSPVALPVTS